MGIDLTNDTRDTHEIGRVGRSTGCGMADLCWLTEYNFSPSKGPPSLHKGQSAPISDAFT